MPCLANKKLIDTLETKRPESVTYIEFIARLNCIGINYEPLLFYDSTALLGLGARGGFQIGLGTTLPAPWLGIRFDVPVVPIIIIGKEYGLEIGTGLDFEWWLMRGFGQDSFTYNTVKLTGIIGYRHYYYGLPHHLFRAGFTFTLQANRNFIVAYFVSFGI